MENGERKRGAPEGNQNARKHGYYSQTLSPEEQEDFELATAVQGIDEEIALLRVKIKSLVIHHPDNVRLITQAVNALERLIRTKYSPKKEDKQSLTEAVGRVLKDIVLPMGISIGKTIKGK